MKTFYIFLLTIFFGFAGFAQAPTANFTSGQTSGCAPIVINFQDLSSGNPTSWQWNFGNGSTSTLQNPSTTYFTPGIYTVTLTATNASGSNTLNRTAYITIFDKPIVNFSANDSTGCAPFNVRFTDLSTPAAGTTNTTWQWDFGDGTGSSLLNPQHLYTATGSYTVNLRVTSDRGCVASFSKPSYIQITGGLSINFSNTGTNRCRAPFPVSFTNNSTGPGALSYFWNFGDGNTSTQQNPSHTYSASGNYTVSLAVTSSNGCTDTLRTQNAVVIQNINTAFTAPDSICINVAANFTNTSMPTAQSSLWNFGDGTTSTAINPVKMYGAPGLYTVQLQQTYSYCTDSFSKPIRVLPKPAAAFTANNTISCQPPLAINFTNNSTGSVSWLWNFGDGNTSTQQNPSHTYATAGNFNVTLIATNASGCTDTLVQNNFIRIQRPVISFPSLPQTGCIPYTTTFGANINTLDNVSSYLWDFGDGNTSAVATPTHTYTTQGNYRVRLTITTSTGCTQTDSLSNAIVVGRIPVIDFTAAPDTACAFGTVAFTGIANEGDTWLWDFGDGTSSSVQNPIHQYTDTGTYTVTFTVTNNGCTISLSKPSFIKVKPPISNFTYQNDCLNRRRFLFTDASIGATSWLWNFGEGNTSTQQNPSHVYAAFGSYNVTLTVMNDTCSHSRTIAVNVFDETPSFSANVRVACKTATINFTTASNNTANFVAYNWDFGNGTTSTVQNPQATYTAAGNYTVRLITTDVYGCNDTATQNNFIRINGPVADFYATNFFGCKGLTVSFHNTSQTDGVNAIVNYEWHYGDGSIESFSTFTPLQHVYNNVGSYTTRLIVTDAAGCKDSVLFAGYINTTSPTASFSSPDTLTCLGSTVSFTNVTTAQNFTSVWDFGDGTTSTLQNPTHVYTDTGYYNIKLRITDQYGCSDSITLNRYIRIEETIASFDVSDSLAGCTPFEIRFTNTSQFYTSSLWQLGNGTSTVNHPTQVYNTTGSYNIQLIVTGRGGCRDTAVRTIQIFDASATTMSYTPLGGCKPLQLTATVNSPANLDYSWDFGDGTIITTTAANTVHTYNVFGNYVPKLLLIDSGNCLIPIIGIDTVRIVGVTAKFGWDNSQFCDSGRVSFTDSTIFNDPITSYTWNFGDGSTASVASPTHNYTSPGLYTVSLALQTQQNCRDTLTINQLIKIVESPSVRIDADSVICQNDFVNYTGVFNRTDTSVVRWAWLFPNGSSSNQQIPPRQQFVTAGNYNIQTIATNTSGCVDTATKSLLVNPIPVITIPSPQITPLGTPVLLPATYTNSIINYSWSPITGLSCTDCAQPLASPKFNTLYTVTAIDDNGCASTAQVQVIVLCIGANVFVPNTFSPNGDGSNDVFYVRGKGLDRVKSLRIFNRWGETVFERFNFPVNDASAGWDGTYKGKKLSPDVFVYQVDVFCDNSESIRFEGNISLIQ
ncbi:MAG: PKD domain-containing protein [Chitinophagaceae bacterium]